MITKEETSRWTNHAEDIIVVEPYNPRWADQFAYEQQAIRECVNASIPLVIEHFGSTAIPGLPAKPIIDILIGASSQHWSAIIEALKSINYVHWENNPNPDREFLVKGMPPFGIRRTHHVHLCEINSPLWERLLFRDYLREHVEDCIAYANLKGRLASEFPDDRDAYTNGKTMFVAEIMNQHEPGIAPDKTCAGQVGFFASKGVSCSMHRLNKKSALTAGSLKSPYTTKIIKGKLV